MHILITNDDGPPSDQSSPYVHSLVSTLQSAGHTVSVVLPHTQRSWIGKAHLVGKSLQPTYFRPGALRLPNGRFANSGTTSTRPLPASSSAEEWILVDSTPASCVQIGLYHYFSARGPVDVVVSGPNYGRNTTAVFSLSSGTVGGAMEAAVCGAKAIALSYAFFDRNHDPDIIAGASALAARLIQHLVDHWDARTQLYSVNVPLVEDVGRNKILYTDVLQNRWKSGSCFQVLDVPDEEDGEDEAPGEAEAQIRKAEEQMGKKEAPGAGADSERDASSTTGQQPHVRYTHTHFKWAPHFKDVYESVEQSEPGNDGWAVAQGYTSVTPLRANFMHTGGFEGEIKLE
ncbi:survival protein sure-like phosphatase/nucleotidase [Massariosphaeria phaeospora]|uniref:Survival protein sure-like phosphatase/nucleotidase n=1 Tax=Massariosphaeria phaeospora TaxID=100035 RepID=A0A7C8I1H1_9PLEO|nr:survival protein sure-like phosphatase/nucleotidase [Massariosphaeria phaeospora]